MCEIFECCTSNATEICDKCSLKFCNTHGYTDCDVIDAQTRWSKAICNICQFKEDNDESSTLLKKIVDSLLEDVKIFKEKYKDCTDTWE